MAYIGSTPTSQNFISGTDYFNGTGSQTAFTLTRTVNSVNDVEVVVNNVIQQPNSYTLSGTTLTLSAAPSSGTSNVYVRYLSTNMQSFTVPANSIDYNKLSSDVQQDLGMSFKNRIINGDMRIDQRNAGASVTQTDGAYTLDRWWGYSSQASKYTVQQNAGAVTLPNGFSNYLGVTVTSAATVGSGDYFSQSQKIEGFNISDLNWGTANAKAVTLSFWVRSSLTGTFGGSLRNGSNNYSYPFTYSIPVANTWTQISITVAGPTSGTWTISNASGLAVFFGLGAGSTYTAAAGSWQSGNYISASSAVNVVSTNGATFYLTGVQLEVGSSATPFDTRAYGTELALCQRYYWQQNYNILYENILDPARISATNAVTGTFVMPVTMRAAPSCSTNGVTNFRVNDSATHDEICNNILLVGSNPNKAVLTFSKATANMVVTGCGYVNTEVGNDASLYFTAEL